MADDYLTYFDRSRIIQPADLGEQLANVGIGLLRIGFGKNYLIKQIDNNPTSFKLKACPIALRIVAIALLIIFAPLNLILIGIGCIGAATSNSYADLLQLLKTKNLVVGVKSSDAAQIVSNTESIPQPEEIKTPNPSFITNNTTTIKKPSTSTTPEKLKESEIPLPHLLNIKLEPNDLLNKNIDSSMRVCPVGKKINILSPDYMYHYQRAWELQTEILGMNLYSYIHPLSFEEKRLKDDRAEFMAEVNKKREYLDKTIDFSKRVENLKDELKYYDVPITIESLLKPWEESGLQYHLMMKDELITVKFTDINYPASALEFHQNFYPRIQQLDLKEELVNKKEVKDLLLVDVPYLTAQYLNDNCVSLPPLLFSLISSKVIPDLIIENLSKEQLSALFTSHKCIEKLTQKQFEDSLTKIDRYLLKFLPTECVLLMNLNNISFDNETFNEIFQPNIVAQLPIDSIKIISKQFSKKQWDAITEIQLKQLLCDDSFEVTEEMFKILFLENKLTRREKYIQYLSLEKTKKLYNLFSEDHWSVLSESQLEHIFNDSSFKLTPDIFNKIFTVLNLKIEYYKKFFQQLPEQDIKDNIRLFKDARWAALSESQVMNILNDKSLADDSEIFTSIFTWNYSIQNENVFKKLDIDYLKMHYKSFSTCHWESLTESQIMSIVKDETLVKEGGIFLQLFSLNYKHKVTNEDTFKKLDLEYIKNHHKLFKFQHWEALTESQIMSIVKDETLVKEGKIFLQLFSLNYKHKVTNEDTFKKLDLEYLKTHHNLFKDCHWESLTEKQIKDLAEEKQIKLKIPSAVLNKLKS